ncbi:MAG: arginase family protein, partial [Rhodospirillales bacterium]
MKILPPEEGFLGLSGDDVADAADKPGVTIVPYGLEASVSYGGGTAAGPQAMIDASHQVELFDEELWREPCRDFHLNTLAPFDIPTDIPAALDQLAGVVGGVLDAGRFPLTFGGEHSITPGAIRPFVERYPDLCLLQFDAHA